MQWFRLHAEFMSDLKVQRMTEADQRRLIMLFCMKREGLLEEATIDDIAFQLRVDIESLKETLNCFEKKGFIEIDGDYIDIKNWDKRQYESDSSTDRVRKHRQKSKQKQNGSNVTGDETPLKQLRNVTVTPPEADTDTDIITSTTADAREENFDNFDHEADSESTPPDQQPSNPEKPGAGFEFYPPDPVPLDDDGAYRGVTYSLSSKKLKEIKAQFPEKSERSIMNALRSYDGNRQNKRLTVDHKLDHLALSKWIANEREPPPAGARASPALTAGQQRADSNRQFLDKMRANFEEEKNDTINGTYTVTSG